LILLTQLTKTASARAHTEMTARLICAAWNGKES
jgi:hypothetical protein